MNNYTVAHVWANEMKEYANGSNFYSVGESIYSYGIHFEIGRIVRNRKGEKAYLVNLDRYSTTTSKRQSYVMGAIPCGSLVFEIGGDFYPGKSYRYPIHLIQQIKEHIYKYKRARTHIYGADIIDMYRKIESFLKFYNKGTIRGLLRVKLENWSQIAYGNCSRESIKQAKELKNTLKVMIDLSAWFDCSNIEEIIVRAVLGDKAWFDYEERCDRYKRSCEDDMLTAGCHRIAYADMAEIATKLGWNE